MYPKLFLLFSTVLVVATTSYAQEKKTSQRYESLKKRVLTQSASDLLAEARKLKETDNAAALSKVEEALGVSLATEDILNESRCYLLLGEINENIREWKLALDNYNSAFEKLKTRHRDTPEYRQALNGLANANLHLNNYQPAIQYYQNILKTKPTPEERIQANIGISEVHYQTGAYREALLTLNNISSGKKAGLEADVNVQNQKAKIYAAMNDTDKAKEAVLQSQNTLRANRAAIPSVARQDESLTMAKEEVAQVLHDQKLYDDEIDLRNKSIEYNLEAKNLPAVTKDKVGLSKALAAKGETAEAIRELEEAALMADTTGNPKDQARAFLALADIYEKHGRTSNALTAYKQFSSAVKKYEQENEAKLTEKSELIKKQKDIEEVTKDVAIGLREETIARATVFRQQLIIYGLMVIILIIAVTSYFIYRNAKASKLANQLLALKSLRSQMNPHFIFNALNSVNQFISQNDERTANKFLSEFSRLMRLVMEHSQEDFIPLQKEQEIIALYLKLEHYRFRDKFDYEIKIDDNINVESLDIPPMLLQPYIENAVWHGLRYRNTKGFLSLHLRQNGKGLEVEISDNGIGRKKSAALKTENQKKQTSTGLKNIQERLQIINKVYKADYNVSITDLDEETGEGTRVIVHLPAHKTAAA